MARDDRPSICRIQKENTPRKACGRSQDLLVEKVTDPDTGGGNCGGDHSKVNGCPKRDLPLFSKKPQSDQNPHRSAVRGQPPMPDGKNGQRIADDLTPILIKEDIAEAR